MPCGGCSQATTTAPAVSATVIPTPGTICKCGRIPWWWGLLLFVLGLIFGAEVRGKK